MEKVARTRVGATLVLADEGPAEGDPVGKCTHSDPNLRFIRALCLQFVFKNVLPTVGGEQSLQKSDRSLKKKAL